MTHPLDSRIVWIPSRGPFWLTLVAVGLVLLVSGVGNGQPRTKTAAPSRTTKSTAKSKSAGKKVKSTSQAKSAGKAKSGEAAEAKKVSADSEPESLDMAPKTAEAAAAEDARTIESITVALRAAGLHGYAVKITFDSGSAQLTGAIGDLGQRARVTEVVSGIDRVETVENRLKIEPRKIPYRVLVSLAVATDPLTTRRSIEALRRGVATVLERTIGETWVIRVEINDWLFPTSVSGLDRVVAERLQSRYAATSWDRVMLVTVNRTGARFDVAGRPFNRTTGSLELPRQQVEYDRRGLSTGIGRVVRDMFGATVDITVGGVKEVEIEVRAGEYPVSDPDSAQLKPGDLLAPFLRYRNRKTWVVERIQPLTWTYLKVAEVKRATARCEVATALRNPLQGGGRGVKLMASGIDSVLSSTGLTLLPRGNLSRPLIGHRVVVLPRRLTKRAASTAAPDEGTREGDEEKKKRVEVSEPRRLLSDRTGRVEIAVDPKMPLVWMYVMSGHSVLARVPFVPGREIETSLMLPDDSARLGVEGHVTRLEGELIETVARRAVHMALAKRSAEAEPPDWTKVDSHLRAIDDLPALRTFEVQIDGIEFSAVEAAQANRDRVAVNRIRTLCRDARTLLAKHLDESKIREFKIKIDDIRKTTPASGN